MIGQRRFLVAAGSQDYSDSSLPNLASVPADVDTVIRLFTGRLGYERVLEDRLNLNPTTSTLEDSLSSWLRAPERTDTDMLVVYYSGHGGFHESQELNQRGFLLHTYSSDLGDPSSSWKLGGLMQPMLESRVKHLLLLIDACFSGQAGRDVAHALDVAMRNWGRVQSGPDVRLMAACRAELADEGVFSRALEHAVLHPTLAGVSPHLNLDEVRADVNAAIGRRGDFQRATLVQFSHSGSDQVPAYLPNPHRPRLEVSRSLPDGAQWWSRARAAIGPEDEGDHFVGREAALASLRAALDTPPDRSVGGVCVITGNPGAGKSTVLARLVIAAHNPPSDVPARADSAMVALDLRGRTVEDVLQALALRTGKDPAGHEPLTAAGLLEEWRSHTLRIVLDSLDEAVEPRRHVEEVLAVLSEVGPADLRLVVGTRRSQLRQLLWVRHTLVDLDDDQYFDAAALLALVSNLLARRRGYCEKPALLAAVANVITRYAGRNHLIAALATRALLQRPDVVDPADHHWRANLGDVGSVLDDLLQRYEAPDRLRNVLRPLALAAGEGLPAGLWADLASALAGSAVSTGDVESVRHQAGDLLVTSVEAGLPVHRLFHQALADHLVGENRAEMRTRFTETLVGRALAAGPLQPPWLSADAYTRRHLATHAAEAGLLDPLLGQLANVGYLAVAAPATLVPLLGAVTSPAARLSAQVYTRTAHLLAGDLGSRISALRLTALQEGASDIVAALAELPVEPAWQPVWTWFRPSVSSRTLIDLHADAFLRGFAALACATGSNGQAVVVVARGAQLVCWRLQDAQRLASATLGAKVTALRAVHRPTGPHVAVGLADGGLLLLDASTLERAQEASVAHGHRESICALAVVNGPGGEQLLASGSTEGLLMLSRLPGLEPVKEVLTGLRVGSVLQVAQTHVGTSQHRVEAIATTASETAWGGPPSPPIRVWAVPSLQELASFGTPNRMYVGNVVLSTTRGPLLLGSSSLDLVAVPLYGDAREQREPGPGPSAVVRLPAQAGAFAMWLNGAAHRYRVVDSTTGPWLSDEQASVHVPLGEIAGQVRLGDEELLVVAGHEIVTLRLRDLDAGLSDRQGRAGPLDGASYEDASTAAPTTWEQRQNEHAASEVMVVGERVAALNARNKVTLWDIGTGKRVKVLGDTSALIAAAPLRLGGEEHVVTATEGGVVSVRRGTGEEVARIPNAGSRLEAVAVVEDVDGRDVVAVCAALPGDGKHYVVRLWDVENTREVDTRRLGGDRLDDVRKAFGVPDALSWRMTHTHRLDSVVGLVAGSRHLVVAGSSSQSAPGIRLWDLDAEQEVHLALRLEGDREVQALAAITDGVTALLAAAGASGSLSVWRLHAAEAGLARTTHIALPALTIQRPRVHRIKNMAFTQLYDRPVLLAPRREGRLGGWDLGGRLVLEIDVRSTILGVTARGRTVIVATDQGLVRFDLSPGPDVSW